jgi:hypothetical protein
MVDVVLVGVPVWSATQRLNPANPVTGRRVPLQSAGKEPDDPSKLRLGMLS